MPAYTAEEQRNLDTLNAIFEGPAEFDRLACFADDACWWNGLPKLPGMEGRTEHCGKDAIAQILYGAGTDKSDRGVDSYDLSTNRFSNVLTMADGQLAMRQHTQHSKTLGGRDYENVYCFVAKFNETGLITYLTEHWNTWYADKVLLENWRLTPARPVD